MDIRIALLVPPNHVKRVKSALEEQGQFDRKIKITAEKLNESDLRSTGRMRIPTTISSNKDEIGEAFACAHKNHILKQLQLDEL